MPFAASVPASQASNAPHEFALPFISAYYSYIANSPLVGQILFQQSGVTRMTTTKQYDFLNRLIQISSAPSSGSPVTFNYDYNQANQRTRTTTADGSYWRYGYDSLGQVISGRKYWPDFTAVAGQQFRYSFDDIGNRTQTEAGGDQTGANLRVANYYANLLNQYTNRDMPGDVDVMGLSFSTNTVTVNGQAAYRKGEYFRDQYAVDNSSSPLWTNITVSATGQSPVSGNVFVPKTPENFTYDADGNLASDGRWNYSWDAENRLISMTARTNLSVPQLLKFDYDSKGRRIHKQVWNNSAGTNAPVTDLHFLYDRWNLLAQFSSTGSLLQSYLWGLDLSGSQQGAGGVGGLLAINDPTNGTNVVAFDGNGNVSALISANDGSVSAVYEYGPFGEILRATGPMAKANPFRWSTKYQDDESDLLYYGYRHYDPSMGRWLNRDLIGEQGFENTRDSDEFQLAGVDYNDENIAGGPDLYAAVLNNPISGVDVLGLDVYTPVPPYKPSDAGKPCCCNVPTKITIKRVDLPPTSSIWTGHRNVTLHLRAKLSITGKCYEDVVIDWTCCWHKGVAGFLGTGSGQDFTVWNPPIVHTVYLTTARLHYLSCDNGVWTKHKMVAGRAYPF